MMVSCVLLCLWLLYLIELVASAAFVPTRMGRSLNSATSASVVVERLRGGGPQDADLSASSIELSGGLVDEAVDWCNNLGAPAALVAGAVIATVCSL